MLPDIHATAMELANIEIFQLKITQKNPENFEPLNYFQDFQKSFILFVFILSDKLKYSLLTIDLIDSSIDYGFFYVNVLLFFEPDIEKYII